MWKALATAANSQKFGPLVRALAMAVTCIMVLAAPADAQFDFLFGRRAEEKPSPADAKPPETKPAASAANQTSGGKIKHAKNKSKKRAAAKPQTDAKAPPAQVEEPLPPYDPELLRLAEVLGALTYLDELCASKTGGDWRAKMQALLEAEAKSAGRRERLAGSYNRGFRDYERSYHFCTPNAQLAIGRFLAEGSKIAHEVVNRYGAS
jgi:uncharacterized protein (TIGR02301 family)